MKKHIILALAACALVAQAQQADETAGLAQKPANPVAGIAPAARDLVKTVSDKLGSAHAIRVEAIQEIDAAIGHGGGTNRGVIEITIKRPNMFYAIQPAGADTREIAYDGTVLCVMHPEMKNHGLEKLEAGTIEQFAGLVDDRFGFRPPLGELLANDMATELFQGVTAASVMGSEAVGETLCGRVHLEQEGQTVDLWVGIEDKLPHRMLITFIDLPNQPNWNIRLSKWNLNGKVDDELFAKRPAADSQKVQMLKSR